MANKTTTTYNDAEHEQDSRRMMERINKQRTDHEAAEQGRSKEKTAEREKTRRKEMCRYIAACAATAAAVTAVLCFMNADLIAPVLAFPASYIGTGYFGWCLHKVVAIFKKGAC